MIALLPTLFLIQTMGGGLLLQRATEVASTADWAGYIVKVPCYEWIGRDSLIYYKGGVYGYYFVIRYDTADKRSTVLDALTETYNKVSTGVGGLEPSPNLRMLLGARAGDPPSHYITDLGGRLLESWPIERVSSERRGDPANTTTSTWSHDSKGVINSVLDYVGAELKVTSRYRAIGNINEAETLPSAMLRRESSWIGPLASGPNLRFIHVGHKTYGGGRSDEATILTWMGREPTKQTRRRISFPNRPHLHDWCISPDGERILWKTHTLDTYSPSSKENAARTQYIDLWISDWRGDRVRHLGRIELNREETYWDWHTFGWMRFVPGRNAVSFVFRHKLYVLDLS